MEARIKAKANQFITEETQFHLGFLPTEQSNPKSRTLEADFNKSAEQGVACLQKIDLDVLAMLGKVMTSDQYRKLTATLEQTIRNGNRVIFSGCGATGRLSILIESMWRNACALIPKAASYANQVESIMTGGDYALVKSVEFFEDYKEFGRRQVQEADMKSGDVLVAITEGGETSSVLGSIDEALERGCAVFLLFNNPADVLREHLERSRKAIDDPRVTVLDLHCGPMALAGSTRMQATTSEQMVAGAALETALNKLIGLPVIDYVAAFKDLLASLSSEASVKAIADYIRLEADIYAKHGKVTYFADRFLLDIFTDTTERSPTFMLPPFRKCDDKISPKPWTFVKNPLYDTADAWTHGMQRKLRCLNWVFQDYVDMGVADRITQPPVLNADELKKIQIGRENVEERYGEPNDTCVLVSVGSISNELEKAFADLQPKFARCARLSLNGDNKDANCYNINVTCQDGPLEILSHIAIKLVLNTISTGTMVVLGRICGNWMSWVSCSNKKLMDRSARLLVELAGVDYRTACEYLFQALEVVDEIYVEKPSPVQLALDWLRPEKDVETLADFISRNDQGWELMLGTGEGETTVFDASSMLNKDEKWSADKKAVTITWKGHPAYGKDFTVTTQWSEQEDGRFEGRIAYTGYAGAIPVERVHFPLVKSHFNASVRYLCAYALYTEDKLIPCKPVEFPVHSMQFSALVAKMGQGVYFDWRDPSWTAKKSVLTLSEDRKSVTCAGAYYVPMDGNVHADGNVPYACSVKFFKGGWYEAAQIYKPWGLKQSWWTNQEGKKNPLADIDMWVWNRGLIKDVMPPVEKLQDELGKDVKVALDWYWWHNNPYDTDYPNFWPPREGVPAFNEAIARLNERNIYSQVYINGVCWDHDTYNWEEGGAEGVRVMRDGNIQECAFNCYTKHRLAWMCGTASKFQEKIIDLVTTIHKSGLTGQYMDQIGNSSMHPCYNKKHNHPMGGGTHHVEGFRNMFKRILEKNPGLPITTETNSEPYMDLVSGGIICMETTGERFGSLVDHVPAFQAIYHGRFAAFGNYAIPDGVTPWDPLWPPEDRWQKEEPWHRLFPEQYFCETARNVIWGTQPMVCNLRMNLFEDPDLAEQKRFLLDTARFYSENKDFLYAGEMLSPEGFECDIKEMAFQERFIFTKRENCHTIIRHLPCIIHNIWKNADGQVALFLANVTQTERSWTYKGMSGTVPPRSYMKVVIK